MNFTGKLEGLKMDYVTRKQSLSLEVNEDLMSWQGLIRW